MKQKINIRKDRKIGIEVIMGGFVIFPQTLPVLKKLSNRIIKYIEKNDTTKDR